MSVQIAIPEPTSSDPDYNQRSLAPYIASLEAVRAESTVLSSHDNNIRATEVMATSQGILLPGSRYDVDPGRYGEEPIPECGEADPVRAAMDEMLLQHAFALRKPILAICQGTQTLNVWRKGRLIQHLATAVNHRPGREVAEAHTVRIVPGSRLAGFLSKGESDTLWVNSSHHQAIRDVGDGLRVSAVSPVDGVIEAVELADTDHFVVAVQWHPERTYETSDFSRAIFAAFVQAARAWDSQQNGKRVVEA